MKGRPSEYSQEVADAICERLIDGMSLRTICAASDMPGMTTVMRWLGRHDDFRAQYARAREIQADRMAEEILDIADTPVEGERREETEDGVKVVREDMLGHRRLQVDARKWLMSKMAPKKYGDRVATEVSGPDGGPIAVVGRIERVIVRPSQKPEDADG